MEDISRELEKEIARAKPKARKVSRRTRIVVIDGLGEMKSGAYLRILARFFSAASLVFALTTAGLYQIYNHQTQVFNDLTQKVAVLEQKTKLLTEEKNIYMARLIMSEPKEDTQAVVDISKAEQPAKVKEKNPAIKAKPDWV